MPPIWEPKIVANTAISSGRPPIYTIWDSDYLSRHGSLKLQRQPQRDHHLVDDARCA